MGTRTHYTHMHALVFAHPGFLTCTHSTKTTHVSPPPPPPIPFPQAKSMEDTAPLDPASKPKARDIQRFLAVAAAMVGDEIEEGAIAPVGGVGSNQSRKDAHKEGENLVNLRDKVKLEGQTKLRAHELEMARRAAALAEEELKASKGKR